MGVGGSITNIVGMGLTAGVAFKVVDMVGETSRHASGVARKGKGKRKQQQRQDSIFDMGFNEPRRKKGKGKRKNNDDIFGGGFY